MQGEDDFNIGSVQEDINCWSAGWETRIRIVVAQGFVDYKTIDTGRGTLLRAECKSMAISHAHYPQIINFP